MDDGKKAQDKFSEPAADASGGVDGVAIPGIHDGESISPSKVARLAPSGVGVIVAGTASGHGDPGSGLLQPEALQLEALQQPKKATTKETAQETAADASSMAYGHSDEEPDAGSGLLQPEALQLPQMPH